MATSSSSKDKFFKRVINPYLSEVLKHPQTIEMHEGVLHIRDIQGPKGTGTVEARLEAMEQEVFKCKGMVEREINANHLMITDSTSDHKVDDRSMKYIAFTLNEQINFLQSQIYDLKNQVFEYEARFKGMSLAASCRTHDTHSSSYDGELLPWKPEDKLTTTSSPQPPSSSPQKET
ncbi:uncharacterized protein [Aegilops tauschii subsp. strangulata]|uniref:uncharacterized protein n=1 Tax=Aegilops tauschii subsp. strangulata TaxID=200361 RepID=UPI00098BBF80|nr:uncharacterized protein LOC109737459 [Aegilops tauschii subsp. strangulata]